MSVMFQLFNAKDLQKLEETEFDALVKAIYDANKNSGDRALEDAAGSDLASHWLEARKGLAKIDLAEITKALRSRASQVFEQLRGRLPDQPPGRLEFDKPVFSESGPYSEPIRREILAQLITQDELDSLLKRDFMIFDVAMSCELSYFLTYNNLRLTRNIARRRYSSSFTPPERPSFDPDSPYSSYPPGHRLHDGR